MIFYESNKKKAINCKDGFFYRDDYIKTPFTIYNYTEFKREDEIKRLLSRLIKSATFMENELFIFNIRISNINNIIRTFTKRNLF